jgi:hypothetical protein
MGLLHFLSRRWIGLALAILTLMGTGCGGRKLYPVQGKVVFPDGSPLKGGWVNFEPVDSSVKVSTRGRILPNGTFRMGTYGDDDGAFEGQYRVMLTAPLPPKLDERHPPPPPIHARFTSYETSGLTFTVTRGANDYKIVVEKP